MHDKILIMQLKFVAYLDGNLRLLYFDVILSTSFFFCLLRKFISLATIVVSFFNFFY